MPQDLVLAADLATGLGLQKTHVTCVPRLGLKPYWPLQGLGGYGHRSYPLAGPRVSLPTPLVEGLEVSVVEGKTPADFSLHDIK